MCFQLTVTGFAHEPLETTGDEVLSAYVTHRINGRLTVQLSDGSGCACSLLRDAADWNEPTWILKDDILQRLASTMVSLRDEFKDGFYFEALWIGDRIKHHLSLNLNEFVQTINENRVANFTRYLVQ